MRILDASIPPTDILGDRIRRWQPSQGQMPGTVAVAMVPIVWIGGTRDRPIRGLALISMLAANIDRVGCLASRNLDHWPVIRHPVSIPPRPVDRPEAWNNSRHEGRSADPITPIGDWHAGHLRSSAVWRQSTAMFSRKPQETAGHRTITIRRRRSLRRRARA